MSPTRQKSTGIQQLDYDPTQPYQLALEAFAISDLRRRGSKEKVRTTHRYTFYMFVCVTKGACTQLIDFSPTACETGSLLTLKPGQAHNFGHDEDWDGWIVLFRPEFLLPATAPAGDLKLAVDLERLPAHLHLRDDELRSVAKAIEQMRKDASIGAAAENLHALLRYQLYALLSRLTIFHGRHQAHAAPDSRALQRFKRFQQLVDQRFAQWHQVTDYAQQLGCTEKSLTRAATAAVGMNAKAFIASRINLEAKRLLVHTDTPVSLIAEKLGFDEATNFSKFFKREAGCTPAEFRRQQAAEGFLLRQPARGR